MREGEGDHRQCLCACCSFHSPLEKADTQNEPTAQDIIFLVFNFTACVPVWMCVGLFSWYHLYLISSNTTTVERWEKDKVATLVRRGKIEEITYPYVRSCSRCRAS